MQGWPGSQTQLGLLRAAPIAAGFRPGVPRRGFSAGGDAQELDFVVNAVALADLLDHFSVNQLHVRAGGADGVAQFHGQRAGQCFDAGGDLRGLLSGQRGAVVQADDGAAIGQRGDFLALALARGGFRQPQLEGVDSGDGFAVGDERGHGGAPSGSGRGVDEMPCGARGPGVKRWTEAGRRGHQHGWLR